jgi:hypothetical protein
MIESGFGALLLLLLNHYAARALSSSFPTLAIAAAEAWLRVVEVRGGRRGWAELRRATRCAGAARKPRWRQAVGGWTTGAAGR